jgi:hypothetical protein
MSNMPRPRTCGHLGYFSGMTGNKGDLDMRVNKSFGAAMAVASIMAAQPAQACWNKPEGDAVTLANFDMMLMVGALRCRKGSNNFLDQYSSYKQKFSPEISAGSKLLKESLGRAGKNGVEALDKMKTEFANFYGGGHPDMGCAEMEKVTDQVLSSDKSHSSLLEIAEATVAKIPAAGERCEMRIARRD